LATEVVGLKLLAVALIVLADGRYMRIRTKTAQQDGYPRWSRNLSIMKEKAAKPPHPKIAACGPAS
jgi:hypothetical protein